MYNGRYHVDNLPYFSWVRSALPLRLSKNDEHLIKHQTSNISLQTSALTHHSSDIFLPYSCHTLAILQPASRLLRECSTEQPRSSLGAE